jgi:hypothetical protein
LVRSAVALFKIYDLIEQSAVPVSLMSKTFSTNSWNDGYFSAKGSFENQSATVPGDELPLQSNVVTCVKLDKTCTVATADVFERFLDLDVSYYDVTSRTDQEITFADDNPICATNFYVINRVAQTVTLIARKRAVIPDYAAKSSLHPCDNVKDANIDLADGFKVYWRKKTDFEVPRRTMDSASCSRMLPALSVTVNMRPGPNATWSLSVLNPADSGVARPVLRSASGSTAQELFSGSAVPCHERTRMTSSRNVVISIVWSPRWTRTPLASRSRSAPSGVCAAAATVTTNKRATPKVTQRSRREGATAMNREIVEATK